MGSSLRERFRQAGNSYEAVGTKVRKDLGDSLKNAVEASSESILSQLGMENTKANSDAVRILSYNNIDITKNNIEQIKQIKESLNTLIEQMNPETVLNMIKDNINPLTSDIESVNDYLINKNKDSDNTDKFSRFLYKLDKTGGISEEERRQFIGIYKMINIYTKDAGNAIGALVKQGADITMENLCRAYDSRKQYGMDNSVGDDTDIAMAGQVRYYLNLFDNTASSVTPLTLKEVNSEKSINTRTVENFCESRKNHERLLEIFAAFLQLEPRAMLVLIGTGRLEQAVRAQAQTLGITDHILFAGLQSNVADWYQMMDLFVMPSRFEGLPVVGIEAQASGLGCVFSDAVPEEVLLSPHAIQIPLSASNADWAAGLQRMLQQPCDRSAGAELIRQAGYDINIAAARLQQQYLQLGGKA